MRWPKYWSFSFSIIPSKEIPGLISFRMDWLDLLVVQGTLKSLLQHHSSKASILRSLAFMVQFSHPYMITGKTIALTIWTSVGKVMFLVCLFVFYILSRFVMEKAMAPHSSTFAWKIPWTEEPGRLQSMGLLESDTTERLHFHFSLSCIGEENGNPLQCSCLENPRDGKPGGLPSMGSHRVGHD